MEKAPGLSPALVLGSLPWLVAAVNVDVPDVTAIVDGAAERQVRLIGVTERAIGAHSVRPVAVVSHPAAAGEAAHADRVAARDHLSHADHPASRAGAKHGAENAADARAVVEPLLDSGRALLLSQCGRVGQAIPVAVRTGR